MGLNTSYRGQCEIQLVQIDEWVRVSSGLKKCQVMHAVTPEQMAKSLYIASGNCLDMEEAVVHILA
jgi:hypothetical protein